MTLRQHPEVSQMLVLLKRQRRTALYHFTDVNNLPLIGQLGGLRSKDYLEQASLLDQVDCGGNQLSKSLDLRHGNWDKVSLSWCPKLPMVYWREQDQHLCYVVVNLGVALQQGVVFTDRNATDNYHQRAERLQGLQILDFDAIKQGHPYPNEEIKKRKQAEILVPDHVPITQFNAIVFRSESSRQEALRLCTASSQLRNLFQVDDRLFILPSAYTRSHMLTADTVTENNVHTNRFRHQTRFHKNQNQVTLRLDIYANIGTRETVRWLWQDGTLIHETTGTFRRSSYYWTWNSLDLRQLAIGNYMVDYLLTGRSGYIHQARIPFQVVS